MRILVDMMNKITRRERIVYETWMILRGRTGRQSFTSKEMMDTQLSLGNYFTNSSLSVFLQKKLLWTKDGEKYELSATDNKRKVFLWLPPKEIRNVLQKVLQNE